MWKLAGVGRLSLFPSTASTQKASIAYFACLPAGMLPAVFVWGLVRSLFLLALQNETYSYIPFVPVVSLTALYLERDTIFSRPRRGWKIPIAITASGLAALVLARWNVWDWTLLNQLFPLVLGFVLLWAGLFGLCFGGSVLRAALFPFLFLGFAVPLPAPVLSGLITFLQRSSAEGVNILLPAFHIPFVRQGFDFVLPGVTIRVAEVCSGIRSTLALAMAAVLAGHLWLRSFPRSLLLCVAIVPIAILKNALRITVLSWLALNVDPKFLFGEFHHRYGGMVFFGFGLLVMGLVLAGLQRIRLRNPALAR